MDAIEATAAYQQNLTQHKRSSALGHDRGGHRHRAELAIGILAHHGGRDTPSLHILNQIAAMVYFDPQLRRARILPQAQSLTAATTSMS
jgi:hypothetical protein